MKIFYFILLVLILFPVLQLKAEKYEAEGATLTNGAQKQYLATASGSYIVALGEGNLSLSINIAEEGLYDISVWVASPYGEKTNTFKIDDNSIDFYLAQNSEYINKTLINSIKLTAGSHTMVVKKSWGWINIDYFELEKVTDTIQYSISKELVTANPSSEAQKLYQFLYDNYGKKIISGAMTLNSMDEITWLKNNTGKQPALVGLDFMHCGRGYTWYDDETPINDAKNYYSQNGIPAFCWHWRDPSRKTEEFYTANTTFDVSKILDSTSSEYAAMISDIDYISSLLMKLQSQNVPVLWRPLHEAAGGWFWWGAKGAEPCKKLYQIMYDRMVNYHGLNNLIWVWTYQSSDEDWYPGDEYVDIVGTDIYRTGDHGSWIADFNQMNLLYDGGKMLTLSECGSFPDPDNLVNYNAAWAYFMPWYGDFVESSTYNSLDLWKKAFAHEYVLTLDEMPDLKSYVTPTASDQLGAENKVTITTTEEKSIKINSPTTIGDMFIYNLQGSLIKKAHLTTNYVDIPLGELPSGIYFVKTSGLHQAVRIILK
jgi:mannan endo-1,4-beta-mannosidase